MFRWYDYLLKGVKNGIEKEKPVKIFVMGKNAYRKKTTGLLPCRMSRFYLHGSKCELLTRRWNASEVAPQSEKADHLLYDPADPVPTIGGILCCDSAHFMSGPHDQRPVESRNDVLVYSTPEFKEDCQVTGRSTQNCTQALQPWIRTSPPSWWMSGRMGLRKTWPKESSELVSETLKRKPSS